MSAPRGFVLADSTVFDQAEYDTYRFSALPSIERHGGRVIIRGGRFQRLEGEREWHRLIGLEFPGMDALHGWYGSDEYQALKAQRLKGAHTDMVFVEESGSGAAGAAGAGAAAGAAPPGTAPAYLIADVEIHDLAAIRPYAERVAATHARHGARYLTRGGASEVAEGGWQPKRIIFIEFPSWDVALAWYRSDEYQALVRIREACATTEMVLVEGYAG